MEQQPKFNWTNWRNRWVWHNGIKVKLRKYIVINAFIMKRKNKAGWQNIDHYLNYKIALSRYGLDGLKHYENLFYNNVPMPYNRTWWINFKLWISKQVNKLKNLFKNGKK